MSSSLEDNLFQFRSMLQETEENLSRKIDARDKPEVELKKQLETQNDLIVDLRVKLASHEENDKKIENLTNQIDTLNELIRALKENHEEELNKLHQQCIIDIAAKCQEL